MPKGIATVLPHGSLPVWALLGRISRVKKKIFNIDLFIWLHRVFTAACGIFVVAGSV